MPDRLELTIVDDSFKFDPQSVLSDLRYPLKQSGFSLGKVMAHLHHPT
jgi:hypothetical protein